MECHVRLLVLSDNLDPDQITNKIGLVGNESWRIGDKRGDTLLLEKENGWSIRSNKNITEDLESHLDDLYSQVKGAEEKFKHISNIEGCFVEVACSIYYKDEPPLNFDKKAVSWLESLGASLDIDLYKLNE